MTPVSMDSGAAGVLDETNRPVDASYSAMVGRASSSTMLCRSRERGLKLPPEVSSAAPINWVRASLRPIMF